MFLLGPIGCQVYVVRTSPRKHRVCAVLLSWFPSPFAQVYLLCQCALPPSQTLGLYSASIFGSLPLLHTFICFVSVLRLANTGFVQCFYLRFPSPFAHVYLFCQCASPRKHRFVLRFPFAHVCLCQCASPRKLRVCTVLFPPSLINLFAFMLCLYFTIDFVLRISPCKLRVCLGQSQSFYLALLFSEVF